jgi:hypothetical protein
LGGTVSRAPLDRIDRGVLRLRQAGKEGERQKYGRHETENEHRSARHPFGCFNAILVVSVRI